ncbi:putative signal transducing protein [Winogradskyella sp. MIT101101]|uniref:putative signal transducing protein n=1 Tax=Winogradskyella sp. MIT101101 TaxID=3098297 RepID=UPI0039994A16
MSTSEYTKVYSGNFVIVTRLKSELENTGIIPIIKDEGESQRLAGYGSMNQGFQEVFVHNDELEKAVAIVERVKGEMEA